MQLTTERRPLYKDPKNALIGGVCAGIAERLDVDTELVRVAAIVASIGSCGLAVALYLILWMILPTRPQSSGVIEVRPRRAYSELYNTVIAKREGTLDADPSSSEASEEGNRISQTAEQALKKTADYRFSLMLLALFCFLLTLAVALIINNDESASFLQFLPLYLIPLGIFFVTSPNSSRSFSNRLCALLLCCEVCALTLPYSIGLIHIDSLYLLSSTSFLLWFIAAVFLLAGIVFGSNACYVLAILLIMAASMSSFYDFGFFDLRAFLMPQ